MIVDRRCGFTRYGTIVHRAGCKCSDQVSIAERHGLSETQRRYLDAFTRSWNKDREARGLAPVLADDALTAVLRGAAESVK